MPHPWTNEEISAIWDEVHDESDRGCVLLCAALLDRGLGHCLRLKFRSLSGATDEDIDKVLKDYPTAALLSFSARARVAHLLGIIPKEVSVTLRRFASLRNVYAHEDTAPRLTLDAVQPLLDAMDNGLRNIVTHLEKLKVLITEKETTGKLRLIAVTAGLYLWLADFAPKIASHQDRPPIFPPKTSEKPQ